MNDWMKNNKFLFSCYVCLLFVMVLMVSIHTQYRANQSDYMASAALANYLWHQGGHIMNWHFSQVLFLFPDFLISSLISLFTTKINVNMFFYGLIQLTLFCVLSLWLSWLLFEKNKKAFFLSFIFLLCALVKASLGVTSELIDPFYSPVIHFSVTLMAYLCLCFAIKYLCSIKAGKPRYRWLMLFALIFILTGVSDSLFLVFFGAPFALTLLFYAVDQSLGVKRFLMVLGGLVALFGLTILVFKSLPLVMMSPVDNHMTLSLDQVHDFIFVLFYLLKRNPINVLLTTGFFIFSLYSLVKYKADNRLLDYALLLLDGVVIITLISVLLITPKYYDPSHIIAFPFRYFQAMLTLTTYLGVPILIVKHVDLNKWIVPRFVHSIIILVFFSLSLFTFFGLSLLGKPTPAKWVKLLFNYYQPTYACFDTVMQKYHLRSGVGTYWVFRPYTAYNKSSVLIASVDPALNAYHWINAKTDYDFHNYAFVISPTMNSDIVDYYAMVNRFGKPNVTVTRCEGVTLYLYLHHQLNTIFNQQR